MKNKLLSIVVLLIALLQLSVIKCFAYVYSGTCGSNLTWNLDTSTKVLRISGTGSMNYYSAGGPWMSYKSSIETIIIEEGVTSIGNKAFYGGNYNDKFSTLKNVYIPSTIQAINDMAFYCCDNIESVYIADIDAWSQVYLPSLQACPFQYNTKLYNSEGMELTEIYFSNGMTEIKDYTFYNCKSIKKVHLPNSVQIIGENTFRASGLESINLDNCVTLEEYAFCNARNLKDVGDVSKVQVLGDAVFEDVNVPLLNLSACQSMGYYVFEESADNIKSIIINRTSIPTFPSRYDGYGFLTARDWDNYGKEEFITTIYVPEASVSEYKSHKIFSTVADHIKPFVITETLNLNASEIHVTMGESKQLVANVSASNGTPSIREVVWSSNNEEVAMVTEYGNVLAKSCGVAIITAKTQDGSNLSKQCIVTVNAPSNSMYFSAVKARVGSTFTLPIYISNTVTISNTQCDLYLPEGMSVKFDEDEEAYLITKGERLKIAHSISCKKQVDGAFRIMITSLSNATIKDVDKSLPVMYVPVEISENVALGAYDVALRNIMITHYDETTNETTPYVTEEVLSMIVLPKYYDVNIHANNSSYGNISIESDTYDCNENITEKDDIIKLNATANDGFRFSHWLVNGSKKTENPLNITVTGNKEIEAVFIENTYVVTFVVDGVVYSRGSQLCGHVVDVPAVNPEKEGYTFVGWDGLTEETVVPAHDVTYNAVFSINQYKVKFIASDVVVYSDKQDYNSPISIPDAPEKEDYVFISWGDVDEFVPAHDVTYVAEYALCGDVHEDDALNVADLTSLVGIILSGNGELTERQMKIADVYVDGEINVADYTSLVGKVLRRGVAKTKAVDTTSGIDTNILNNLNITEGRYIINEKLFIKK